MNGKIPLVNADLRRWHTDFRRNDIQDKLRQSALDMRPSAFSPNLNKKGFFITATDTGVGKTVCVFVLATLLREKGFKVGVMKPVQCGGKDAQFLKKHLDLHDDLRLINPYDAPESLSPHLAFERAKIKIDRREILKVYRKLESQYDIVLVEGAGGLMVPLTKDYLVADLIRDLDLDVILVSRLGLGTINHSLLTINQLKDFGLNVAGIIFNSSQKEKPGIAEKTNPKVIKQLSGVKVLGILPYMKRFSKFHVLSSCLRKLNLGILFNPKLVARVQMLESWDKKHVWHPFTQMKDWLNDEPLIIEKGKGSYLTDVHGRRYIDGVSSLWVNIHGHGHPKINQAIKSQINRLSHSTLLGLGNVPSIELAKKLIEIAPKGLEKVFYSDNGSTAAEVAIKIAFQYWQNQGVKSKRVIAHLENSYHGDTLGSVSIGGIDMFHEVYGPLTFQTLSIPCPYYYRDTKGESVSDYMKKYLAKVEKILKEKHLSLAAFIVEPLVQGAAGMIMWPDGVLQGIFRICRKYDIFLVVDEVATGFGRTGKMFACEHEGVTPDLMCLAKGITGGYLPLAATLTTKKVFDGFVFDYKEMKTFFHGHTYTGNPLACAAAIANLDVFEEEKTLQKLQPKIKFLSEQLKKFNKLTHVGDIRQKGFMVGIELVKNKQTKEAYPWEQRIGVKVCMKAREKNIILRPLGNVIVFMPPLAISLDELKILLDATYNSIDEITRYEKI